MNEPKSNNWYVVARQDRSESTGKWSRPFPILVYANPEVATHLCGDNSSDRTRWIKVDVPVPTWINTTAWE